MPDKSTGDLGADGYHKYKVWTRVFNSGRGKKSEPTDKTDISGISGFFIFIFYFFIFLFIF